jgi:riboflavin kinase/FMN adenylyltransferase
VQRFTGLDAVPADFGPSVVTIGNFDGVHRGHQAVLASVIGAARRRGVPAVAVTFDPHPVAVLYPERAPAVLTTTQDRLRLLEETGLDAVLLIAFTLEFARWSPERFVREVFVDALHAEAVVVGRDTRFGYRNSGDLGTLRELGEKLGFEVEVVEEFGAAVPGEHGGGRRWSSSWVRELLAEGDVAAAARILGRPHRVVGVVVHGDHRGRELGYPTANLAQDAVGQIPADGVYAGRLVRPTLAPGAPDAVLPAAVSIGTNPTFDGTQRRVEAYVLDRDDLDLYGERVAVEFVERLRPTLRFDGVGPLIEQMAADVTRARAVLGAPEPTRTPNP